LHPVLFLAGPGVWLLGPPPGPPPPFFASPPHNPPRQMGSLGGPPADQSPGSPGLVGSPPVGRLVTPPENAPPPVSPRFPRDKKRTKPFGRLCCGPHKTPPGVLGPPRKGNPLTFLAPPGRNRPPRPGPPPTPGGPVGVFIVGPGPRKFPPATPPPLETHHAPPLGSLLPPRRKTPQTQTLWGPGLTPAPSGPILFPRPPGPPTPPPPFPPPPPFVGPPPSRKTKTRPGPHRSPFFVPTPGPPGQGQKPTGPHSPAPGAPFWAF